MKPAEKPPKLALWLLNKLLGAAYAEELHGDLQEVYEDRVLAKGKPYARLMYWVDSFHLLMGFSRFRDPLKIHNFMIKNMFKIAWRHAIRQKRYTLLNTLGLTLGVLTCFVIGLFVHQEQSYDTFHHDHELIYRVNQPNIWGAWDETIPSTGPNVAVAMREDLPEFEEVTRLMLVGDQIVRTSTGSNSYQYHEELELYAAEPNFFDVFTFPVIAGAPKGSLDDPYTLAITQRTAKRYFGERNALGQTIELKEWDGSWQPYTVTAVLVNPPQNSHIQFDMLMSFASHSEMLATHDWKWIWTVFGTYGKVRPGTNIAQLTEKMQALPKKWAVTTTERIFDQTLEEFTEGHDWTLSLQPLTDIYRAGVPEGHPFGPTGNPELIRILTAVGFLVLLLCSINFMNLTTARSANRAKEVGVRRVMGSLRGHLINQFIFESILHVALSTVTALLLLHLGIQAFNELAETSLSAAPYLNSPAFYGLVLSFTLALGVLAGLYPALHLSGFQPIDSLKGKVRQGLKGKGLRNGLIVVQFSLSIVLIIGTLFVQKQIAHSTRVDVGFAKDNILQIHNIARLDEQDQVLFDQLNQFASVTQVSKSFGVPPYVQTGDRYQPIGNGTPAIQLHNLRVDEAYLELLGVNFIQGRNFDLSHGTDKYGVVLNEAAVKALGWGTPDTWAEDTPIGKRLALPGGAEGEMEVIGVVKDFHFQSVQQSVEPLVILSDQNDWLWDYNRGLSYFSLRLNPQQVTNLAEMQQVIDQIETAFKAIDPSIPFEYSFMDESFEATLATEMQLVRVLKVFTLMALFIAGLGLFGLATFATQQRSRELSIRKVLGARVSQLVFNLSSEFTRLILLSIAIAVPIAWWLVDQWLTNFATRTSIGIGVFVLAGVGALLVGFLSVGSQSLTAARKNPTENLHGE